MPLIVNGKSLSLNAVFIRYGYKFDNVPNRKAVVSALCTFDVKGVFAVIDINRPRFPLVNLNAVPGTVYPRRGMGFPGNGIHSGG